MSKLNAEFKEKWVKALRSGEYTQCKGKLKIGDGYCCIGVAAVVAGYAIDEANDFIVRANGTQEGYGTISEVGLDYKARIVPIGMNDEGKSFAEIADYVEENL